MNYRQYPCGYGFIAGCLAAPFPLHLCGCRMVPLSFARLHLQGISLKNELLQRLMSSLVLPQPDPYRPLLRRLGALTGPGAGGVALRAQVCMRLRAPLQGLPRVACAASPCLGAAWPAVGRLRS